MLKQSINMSQQILGISLRNAMFLSSPNFCANCLWVLALSSINVPPAPRYGATHLHKYCFTVSASHFPTNPFAPGCFLALVQLSNQVAITSAIAGASICEKRACKTFARVPFPHVPASMTAAVLSVHDDNRATAFQM